ncbi:Prolyl oligopeptidase family protein [compost metagenome]
MVRYFPCRAVDVTRLFLSGAERIGAERMTRSMFEQYEDQVRLESVTMLPEFQSTYQDLRYYESSVTPGIRLAINIIKPDQPSFLLVQLHGWHMSMPEPQKREEPLPDKPYLVVQVDMRGRVFSEGTPDCNGFELIDIYDAIQFVREHYASLLLDPEVVYLEGGSGGGGNVLAAINKFPDLFAAATALYGIADYAEWYACDRNGEFRDDMDIWIGTPPWESMEPYEARSGAHLVQNQLSPLLLAHGTFDARVPVSHSRLYMKAAELAGKAELIHYIEWPGVGGEGHTDRLPQETLADFIGLRNFHKQFNTIPPLIARKGNFRVGGYLYTKQFVIWLDRVDHTADLTYDLDQQTFMVTAKMPYAYRIKTITGEWIEGTALSV